MKDNLNNDKELFYKATSTEALIEAWTQLKSNPGMLTPGSDNETLQSISKHWFETVSEKLRKGHMMYPKTRRIEVPKPTGKLGKRPLTINNPRIKIIERALLNAIEPHFEGIFEWVPITEKEYQKLVTEKSTYIKKSYDVETKNPIFLKSKWISPRIFKDSSLGFRPNRSAHTALHRIKHWRTNTVFFLSCDIKKAFDKIQRNRLKNAFNAVIVDERFWIEIQKMLNAGFVKENLAYYQDTGVLQGSILSPFLFNIYMHSFDEFIERLNKPNKESYKEAKNSQYGDQEARKAYKHLQYKYGEGINHTLRKFGSKEVLMKQRKIDYAEHYKKYKVWSGIDKDNKFISYVRYADDFLIGIIGSRKYALQVKQDITNFLKSNLHLDVSKSELVNRNEGKVSFLGHFIKLVNLKMKTRVQNKKIAAAQKAKNRILSRIKVNDQRLARALFLRTQKKTIEILNNVSKLYAFKPTSKKNIEITALNSAIEHLEAIRYNILLNSSPKSSFGTNFAMNRLQKCNDERIQLDEQAACYTLFDAIKSVTFQINDQEPKNISQEILKELKKFEKSVEKIVKNVETDLIDKKRQSLIVQHTKRENKRVSGRLLSSTTRVEIRVSADIKYTVNKLRLKGFFHATKDRPRSNPYLVNLSDAEIIKHYNSIMLGLLNWFSGSDNLYAVKGIIQALRKSCALTLKLKHKYKSLFKVYTIYGLDISTHGAALCSRSYVLNKKKQFNIGNKTDMRDHNELWQFIDRGRSRSHGLSFFSCCAVRNCNNTDIEIHHMARLHRTIEKNGMRSVVDKKGRRVSGINAILTSIRRKQLPLCKVHHLEFEKGKFSDLDYSKLNDVLNKSKNAFSFPSDFKSIFEGKPDKMKSFKFNINSKN
jgi:retron-type reverse transcriptase